MSVVTASGNAVVVDDRNPGTIMVLVWGARGEDGAVGGVDVSGTPVTNDFARFTDSDTLEGRSYAEAKADLSLEDADINALADARIAAMKVSAPAGPSASGAVGQWAWTSPYLYRCVDTDTWVRYIPSRTW